MSRLLKRMLKADLASVLAVLAVMVLVMACLSPGFLTIYNINVVAQAFSVTAVVGLAQMVIIGTGGMNLAVGAIGGLVSVVTGGAMAALHLPTIVAVIIGLLTGATCGAFNGYLITRGGSSSVAAFLVTLATSSVFTGITLGLTRANPFYNLNAAYIAMGSGAFLGFPIIMYVMVGISVIVWLVFRFSGIGRRILAIGSNMSAAALYGISVKGTTIIAHVFSGLLAAAAAILLVARIGSAQTDIGSDWLMFSFAAPIIGGTRQAGGKVNIPGTVVGAIVLSIISNALVHLKIDAYWMTFIQGCIILLAVTVDRLRYIRIRRTT